MMDSISKCRREEMKAVCPRSSKKRVMCCETSYMMKWKMASAIGEPGRVPLCVWINVLWPIDIQVEACTFCKRRIKYGGAPSSSKIPGSDCPSRRWSHGCPACRSISMTLERLLSSRMPTTISRIKEWKAVLKSIKSTPILKCWAVAVWPKIRSACDPKSTSCCEKPPSCPGERMGFRIAMMRLRKRAWNPLAKDGKSRIPRKCLASVGWRRFGIRARGPPLYCRGSSPQIHILVRSAKACSASSAGWLWKRADESGSCPVALPALLQRRTSSSSKSVGNSVHVGREPIRAGLTESDCGQIVPSKSEELTTHPASKASKWGFHWSSRHTRRRGSTACRLCRCLGKAFLITRQSSREWWGCR